MEKKYDLILVGGGFSALVLLNALKLKNKKVAVIERLDRLGKKILSTGNGRGNLTNKILSSDYYHGQDPSFCEYAITRFDNFSIRSFFSELGLMFTAEENKIYPSSMQANAISDALRRGLDKKGFDVYLNSYVNKIENEGNIFKVYFGNEKIISDRVVLSFGGSSQKQFGTDGSSYILLKKLGHSITPLYPSLVQMRSKDEIIKGLRGVKSTCRVSLLDGSKQIKSTYGDLLFTDNGVSGNAIFYLSSYLSGLKKPVVKVEFAPDITENRLIDHLLYFKTKICDSESYELLSGVIHKQIAKNITKSITRAKLVKDITKEEIVRLVKTIKTFSIDITGTLGFDYSQVTHGGAKTCEFDNRTFESKIVKNLYATGELLDIDGDCGGYNLQWAYSSAMCVAERLNAEIK